MEPPPEETWRLKGPFTRVRRPEGVPGHGGDRSVLELVGPSTQSIQFTKRHGSFPMRSHEASERERGIHAIKLLK